MPDIDLCMLVNNNGSVFLKYLNPFRRQNTVQKSFQFPDESPPHHTEAHINHNHLIAKMEVQGIFASTTGNLADSTIEGGDHSVVISVVENRAREICICKMDTLNVIFDMAGYFSFPRLTIPFCLSGFCLGDIYGYGQSFV